MMAARYAKLLTTVAVAALAVSCASTPPARTDAPHPTSFPTASQAVATPLATASAEASARASSPILDDRTCPADWREALSFAWGYMDDLAAPRSVFPDRRTDIDQAVPLVDGMPRWKPGEVARTSLAYALALYEAAEVAHDAGEAGLEAELLSTVEVVSEQAWSAYVAIGDEESDPCYRPPEGDAGG